MLLQHFGDAKAGVAFFEPAVSLFVNATLDQGLLNGIVRGVESGRRGAAGLRAGQESVLVKILDGPFVDLHCGAEARVQIAVKKELVSGNSANVCVSEAGEL